MKRNVSLPGAVIAVFATTLTAEATLVSDFRFDNNLLPTGGAGPSLAGRARGWRRGGGRD